MKRLGMVPQGTQGSKGLESGFFVEQKVYSMHGKAYKTNI